MQILLWDTESSAITAVLTRRDPTLGQYKQRLSSGVPESLSRLAVSPDGRTLATATIYDDVWLWDTTTGEGTLLHDSGKEQPFLGVTSLVFTPDGQALAYLDSQTDTVYVLDAATGSEISTVVLPADTPSTVIALSPDGAKIAWIDAAQKAAMIAPLNPPGESVAIPLPPSDDEIHVIPQLALLRFTPDGSQLVVGGLYYVPGTGENSLYVVNVQP
jgi:WD40 repeat protein